jgi:putative ABC transport system permease protein
MRLTGMALANLGRRPLRTTLTALGIAVAVGCLVVMTGLSGGLERAWSRNLQARGTHILAVRKGAVDILSAFVEEEAGGRIRRVPGVQGVAEELVDMMTLEGEETAIAQGWPLGCYLWETLRLSEGRLPRPGEADGVVLGQSVAGILRKRPGDSLAVWGGRLRVLGVFQTGSVIGNNSVTLPLETMQALLHREGKVTAFNIRVDRPEDPARIADVHARLQAGFPDLSIMETSAVAENDLVLRFFRAMAWSVSATAILIALVVMLNTLLMSVLERTREIGILTSVGWQAWRIGALIACEGLLLAVLGGAAGLGLGSAGLRLIARLPRVRGLIEVELTWGFLAGVFAVVLLLGAAGSLYPALRSARLSAMDALRHE